VCAAHSPQRVEKATALAKSARRCFRARCGWALPQLRSLARDRHFQSRWFPKAALTRAVVSRQICAPGMNNPFRQLIEHFPIVEVHDPSHEITTAARLIPPPTRTEIPS